MLPLVNRALKGFLVPFEDGSKCRVVLAVLPTEIIQLISQHLQDDILLVKTLSSPHAARTYIRIREN